MANHKSASKRARQALKRRARNRSVRSEVRRTVKAVRQAIEAGDASEAQSRLRVAEGKLRKAASKGVLKRPTADRSVARLARAVSRVGA
ncbi:MAG: 30S ribosomal protein S20 [Deltaproteobacteria bacterium]|nr:30S ribosomal protein S20 [Deltaproteobacteria bacterium]